MQPRKRFGQHFLQDQGLIQDIIHAIDPHPGDSLVEIGPGLGALTLPLLARVPHLTVIELDRDLVARWRRHPLVARLSLHEADALGFDYARLGQRFRLVGNLPYNISTPLLFHLANFAEHIVDAHFMLQKEVVQRMVATAGDPAYGRLSLMLQLRFHMECLLQVPPSAFNPPPKVDSAVVRLIPRSLEERLALWPGTMDPVNSAPLAVSLATQEERERPRSRAPNHASAPEEPTRVDPSLNLDTRLPAGESLPEEPTRVDPRLDTLGAREKALERVVTQAFSQRRKMLRSTLKGLLGEATLTHLGIDPTRRAETLTLEEFVLLAQHLTQEPPARA